MNHRDRRSGPVWTLIDAHNLIHADSALRALMSAPEVAREALAGRVRGRARLRLVCDGGPGGVASECVRDGVTLEFSGAGSADDCIVLWLTSHPQARAVVVTDDRDLARRSRSLGARVMDCAACLRLLVASPVEGDDPRRAPPAAHEVDLWLREFGYGDEESASDG